MNLYEALRFGSKKQQNAYIAIEKLQLMKELAEYTPILCGTIPIEIDTDNSDLDIIMEVHDFDKLKEKLFVLYGDKTKFRLKRTTIRGREVVKANFSFMEFEFELFGQDQSVYRQYAYLHMVIEQALLKEIPSLKDKVIELKEIGYKTESAFCEVLGIEGDPYDGLIRYGKKSGIIN